MVHTVGSYQAKTHLPELLARVAQGDTITITKRGKPVAQLVPPVLPARPDPATLIQELLDYSRAQQRTLGKLSVRELIEEGRR